MNGKATVVGVVSWGGEPWNTGDKCGAKGLPGVYNRVTSSMNFIEEQLKKTWCGAVAQEPPRNCGQKPSNFL